jgi:PAS domain S-box-containing protein
MNSVVETIPTAAGLNPMLDIDELPLPYVEVDVHGVVIRANRAALALHHPDQGELVGKSGWELMALDEKVFSHDAFSAQMQYGMEPPVIIRNIFDRSGGFRTYQMHRSFIRDAVGNPAGMSMVLVDITDPIKQLDEMQHSLQWYENAIGSLADAVVLTDPLGFVRTVNRAAEKLFRSTAQELAGKIIEEAIPILAYEALEGPMLDRRTAIERHCKGIATLFTREHQEMKVEISTAPIVGETNGSIVGVAALLRKLDRTVQPLPGCPASRS